MSQRKWTRGLLLFIFCELALGASNAYQEQPGYPGGVTFLAFWSTLPTVVGWALASLPFIARRRFHVTAMLAATYFVSILWTIGLLLGQFAGPSDPDTAGHMGHFLWPPLLCFTGAFAYGAVFLGLVVVRGRPAA